MEMPKSFNNAKEITKNIVPIHLGQSIETPYGVGIVVKLDVPFNGLYLSPERGTFVIWYGTENANPWVSKEFRLFDLCKEEQTEFNIID